ncbi:MAG: YbfB/YjiJ family MFS transporter [Rhodocyclaceae bacterium]|nr:YbfB/YjiJ family MFS transporter [Rhodocyclaceae bacterium]
MSDSSRQRFRVLAAGVLSLVLCMGVARFAYTPLLPLMQDQAGLSAAGGGWLAAWNYLGYLTGALIAANISDLVLKDRLYRIGMVLAVVSTAAMALATSTVWWCLWRFIAGLSTAAGMLLGTGLILHWLLRHDHRPELGIHFSGVGLGIALSAAAVSAMRPWFDWDGQWLLFSVGALALMVPALSWLPRPALQTHSHGGQPLIDAPPSSLFQWLFMAAYFCAGIGYVVSATFIVAIVDDMPGLEGRGSLVFLAIGLAAAPASILWDLIARRIGILNAVFATSALQVAGIVLPLAGGLPAALAGAALFGFTVIGLVSLVLTLAGRYYPSRPAKMMGKMTLSYGVAQILAPAIIGWIAEHGGSYADGLVMAAAAMVVGSLLLLGLKLVERRDLRHAAAT